MVYLLYIGTLRAQDTHYWSNQYGTRADLLGGIVIGSVKDLSSVYYNPGAVSFSSERSLVISTHAFDITYMKWHLPNYQGKEYNSIKTRPAPVIFAIRLTENRKSKHNFVISYLEKEDIFHQIELYNIPSDQDNDVPIIVQDEYDELIYFRNITEYWGGITWSYTYSKNLGIGCTLYGSYRNEEAQNRFSFQRTFSAEDGMSLQYQRKYDISNIRIFTKLGVFYEDDSFSLGVTSILPSIPLFGWASLTYLDSRINVPTDQSNTESSILSITQSTNNTVYKYPFTIGIGGSFKTGKTTWHLSLEWFKEIPVYTALKARDVTDPVDGEKINLDVHNASRSVLNYGIGFQHSYENDIDFYVALRTDFSSKIPDVNGVLNLANYNKYFITSGAAFKVFDYFITSGISVGFGSSNSNSLLSILLPNLTGDDLGEVGNIDVNYYNIKFIFGFSF
ncbi:MAG TPA: hypothetical protein ENK44_02735 [Caldithrix abyssi]|uniref:Uncharacterized protein n=1 Tax=Caldithrix abyssi TaxID=187145 RepID=A0A7V4TZQ3_CALAY|nr:hypothetical protein [Caldithrix abyssi]